jgi:hypothetical protein
VPLQWASNRVRGQRFECECERAELELGALNTNAMRATQAMTNVG